MVLPFLNDHTKSKIVMTHRTEDLTKNFDRIRLPSSIGGSSAKDDEGLLIPIESLTQDDIDY